LANRRETRTDRRGRDAAED